jgi:hypothetical protein
MNRRPQQFWIPAALSLGTSMGALMLLQKLIAPLHAPWKHAGVPVLPYLLWTMSLPLIGAVTAYVSARAGSSTISRLVAVLFPAFLMLAIWLFILAFAARRPVQWSNFFFGLTLWALIPGACLALGNHLFFHSRNAHKLPANNARLKRFWLPALASLCSSLGILALSSLVAQNSYFLARGWSNQVVYLPWLALSPLCGAAGAYLSRRAGGRPSMRLLAGLFPGIAMLSLGIALVLTGKVVFVPPHFSSMWRACTASIILPSLALLLGVLPFLGKNMCAVPKTQSSALQ